MKNKELFFVLGLTIVVMPLTKGIFLIPWFYWLILGLVFVVALRYKKYFWITIPVLIIADIYINKLLSINFSSFSLSMDWEKMSINNPAYFKLIDKYRYDDVWLPYHFRGLFYSGWLLIWEWINLFLKLVSVTFQIRVLGYSGFFLQFLGLIEYFKDKERKSSFLIWWLTIMMASAMKILVDSNMAVILALPAIIYFMYFGIKGKNFKRLWILWLIMILIDVALK